MVGIILVPAMQQLMRKVVISVIECVVERRITMGGKIIKWLMLVLCGVTGIAALLTVNFLPSFLCTAGITAYYCRHYNVEFEYGFCGGVLTIDAIIAGKKRKRKYVWDFNEGEIEKVLPFRDYKHPAGRRVRVVDCASGRDNVRVYVIIVDQKRYIDKIIFEPNDELLKAIYHVSPAIVKL